MPANTTVAVPPGSNVKAPDGSVINLAGTGDTAYTLVGAVVTVPAGVAAAASDLVITGPASGNPSPRQITVLAGSATTTAAPVDGVGTAAILWGGGNLAIASTGDIVFSDQGRLRKATQAGVVTTLSPSHFGWQGIALDAAGDIFGNLEQIGAGEDDLSTLYELKTTGTLVSLLSNWQRGAFGSGAGPMAIDAVGDLFFAEVSTDSIIKFPVGGGFTVVAASVPAVGGGAASPFGLAANSDLPIDAQGNLYVLSGGTIRKITPSAEESTVKAGLAVDSSALALDPSGNFYAAMFGPSTASIAAGRSPLTPFRTLRTSSLRWSQMRRGMCTSEPEASALRSSRSRSDQRIDIVTAGKGRIGNLLRRASACC